MSYLQNIWTFVQAHPELWPVVAWPVLTALVSFWHSKIEPRFPRLAAFLRAAGVDLPRAWGALRAIAPKVPPLPILALLLCGCTGEAVVRDAIDASNAASQAEQIVAPVLERECVAPMRAADAQGKAELAKTCDARVAVYASERRAHLLVIAAIVSAESGSGVTVGKLLTLVHDLAGSIAVLMQEYVK